MNKKCKKRDSYNSITRNDEHTTANKIAQHRHTGIRLMSAVRRLDCDYVHWQLPDATEQTVAQMIKTTIYIWLTQWTLQLVCISVHLTQLYHNWSYWSTKQRAVTQYCTLLAIKKLASLFSTITQIEFILIKKPVEMWDFSARRLTKKFSTSNKQTLDDFLWQLKTTISTEHVVGSSRLILGCFSSTS